MATHPVKWGTYKEIAISLTLNDVPYPFTSSMEMYLFAKLSLEDTDDEAVFRISTKEGTIVMSTDTVGPNVGKGTGKIRPEDTIELEPSEKTTLFYDVRLIDEVAVDDIRPYVTDDGKIVVLPVSVRRIENEAPET